jgi:hypothetical protein
LFAEDLDFDRAFEATFTRDPARRRKMITTGGLFGNADLTRVDDATLVSLYKSHMQIAFLTLLLIPGDDKDKDRFLPPEIDAIYSHGVPSAAEEFPSFALQLKREAATLRAHLDQLAAKYPDVAERVRGIKLGLSKPIKLPNYVVKPHGKVLGLGDRYSVAGGFTVIREGAEMKIIEIQLLPFL